MRQLQDLDLGRNEVFVIRHRVALVTPRGEIDFFGPAPDGVSDPHAHVVLVVAPAQPERLEGGERAAPEEQDGDEVAEPLLVDGAAVAGAGVADVDARRGRPHVAPPPGDPARAHRLPRLQVRHDPEQHRVREGAETVAATAGRARPRRSLSTLVRTACRAVRCDTIRKSAASGSALRRSVPPPPPPPDGPACRAAPCCIPSNSYDERKTTENRKKHIGARD
uniref:Uncharacterized protein n=1 Tax=Oryza glumipatula TaxID=40148 RepID=A0A0E0ARX7_9ORYZ